MLPKDENWFEELQELLRESKPYTSEGACASYIPALRTADPNALGLCLLSKTGDTGSAGEWDRPFTMQSVSKIINFLAACEMCGIERVLDKVDVEPTGDAFDSIIRLEAHKPGKPFNPMINAGAITIASMLPGDTHREKFGVFQKTMEQMLGKDLQVSEDVYRSERESAHRNRALAYYLKSLGYLDGDVEEALEVYIRECAVLATAHDLAEIGLVLACDGYHPLRKIRVVSKRSARIVKSLMMTCGMYNASGKFAAFVGIPAKSGVSGAILAAVPSRDQDADNPFQNGCGIGIYGPAIDEYGNSTGGLALLRKLSEEWDLSVF